MPKKFYTERDIEDMAARGQLSLTISDDVVLTELAYEKAERLGVNLIQPHDLPPAAPVRPYFSDPVTRQPTTPTPGKDTASAQGTDLRERIRTAVKAQLGNQVDAQLLETIITRVLNNIGVN